MSITAPPAPVLTPIATFDPCPRVAVAFTDLDAAATLITVYRIADGEQTAVRGAQNAAATAGAFVIVDYEAPFGVELTYQAQLSDGTQTSPLGPTASATLDVDDIALTDPLDPASTVRLSFTSDALTSITQTDDTELITMMGRSRPIVQSFGLGSITQMPINVMTETVQDAIALRELLDASPLLLRTPGKDDLFADLPRGLYCRITASRGWPGWVLQRGARKWTLTADEVQPQSMAVIAAVISWQTYMDAFPTWQDAMNVYTTWEDAMLNPPGGF